MWQNIGIKINYKQFYFRNYLSEVWLSVEGCVVRQQPTVARVGRAAEMTGELSGNGDVRIPEAVILVGRL